MWSVNIADVLKQKHSQVLLTNISGSVIIKAITLLITFFTMPLYIRFFDNQAILGVCFTLLSMLNWIFTFDFGIGNGMRNMLVKPLFERDYGMIRKYISSGYLVLGGISAVFLCVGSLVVLFVDWNSFFDISSSLVPNSIFRWTASIMLAGIVLQFFFKLITSILYAMQKIVLINILAMISSILILFFVLIGKTSSLQHNLVIFAGIQAISLNLPLLVVTVAIFSTKLRAMTPRVRFWDKESARAIVTLGGGFFVIQCSLLFLNSTNEIILTQLFSSSIVVDYSIYRKVFLLILFFFTLLTQPTWSAITQAYAENRTAFIRKVYYMFLGAAVLGVGVCMITAFNLQALINLWLRSESIPVQTNIAVWFGLEAGVTMFILASTVISNGIGKLRCQMICTLIAALAKIPVAVWLASRLGEWHGIIIANIVVVLPLLLAMPLVNYRYLSSQKNITN